MAPLLPALLQPLLASSSAEIDAAARQAWGGNQPTRRLGARARAEAHGAGRAEYGAEREAHGEAEHGEARAPPAVAGGREGGRELRDERRWQRLLLLCTDPADAAAVCTSVHRLLQVSKQVGYVTTLPPTHPRHSLTTSLHAYRLLKVLPRPPDAAEVDVLCAGRVLAATPSL